MGYRSCSLCEKWNSSSGICMYTHTPKSANDSCSAISLIPCCASCKHWSANCDYMNKGNCNAFGGKLSPADSICNTGDYQPLSSSNESSSSFTMSEETEDKLVRFLLTFFLGFVGSFIINHTPLKPKGFTSRTGRYFWTSLLVVGILYTLIAAIANFSFDPSKDKNIGYKKD